MISPRQEQSLLDTVALGIDDDLRAAYRRLIDLIGEGMPPRDAVAAVLETFTGQYAQTLADGFSAILERSVGSASVLAMKVGEVSLSSRLYAEARDVSAAVQTIVTRHAAGWQDARALTLELYEGYGFRADEPLKISPRNPRLPQYLRSELLTDPGLAGELSRHFTEVHVSKLKTPALRAAYLEYLDEIKAGRGQVVLERRLDVAFHEQMRYRANRIAQTELHRAYAEAPTPVNPAPRNPGHAPGRSAARPGPATSRPARTGFNTAAASTPGGWSVPGIRSFNPSSTRRENQTTRTIVASTATPAGIARPLSAVCALVRIE